MKFFFKSYFNRRYQIQKILLTLRGAELGSGNTFNGWLKVVGDVKNLKIGDYNVFNEYILINCKSKIIIGDWNHFSVGTKLISTRLSDDLATHISYPITIRNYCWTAVDSVIAINKSPIVISDNIIIGAKSLIFKSLEEKGKYYGIHN
jgi:acetyltransferase-like isoleucine patch superfamily enzyme